VAEPIFDAAFTMSAVALAAIFLVAAVSKLFALDRVVADFVGLGLPRSSMLVVLVVAVESVAAAALLLRPRIGAAMAALMLVVFTAVVARALATGRSVSCGCFGPLSQDQLTSATLARNAALLMLAVLAGLREALVWPAMAALITVSLAAVMAAVGVQLLTMNRQLGRIWSVELAGEATLPEEEL